MLEGECSPAVRVISVVPQGSNLGPLLLLLYVNDLPDYIQSHAKLFADGTAVYLTVAKEKRKKKKKKDAYILQK